MHPHEPTTVGGSVERIRRLVLRTTAAPWTLAVSNRAAIAAHFESRRRQNPSFYDGEVFVLRDLWRADDGLAGTLSLERFSAFLYWRDGLARDDHVRDAFVTALVRSAEGHVLVGRAAAGTLNEGRLYLPGGFIDARDARADGTIDIDAGIARELAEETGLDATGFDRVPGYLIARQGRYCCLCAEFRASMSTADLSEAVRRGLSAGADGELSAAFLIRDEEDLARHHFLDHARLLIGSVLRGH